MYWTYLINLTNNNILTFESNNDLNKLFSGYCELVIDNFFSSFSPNYDSIFISTYGPDKDPLNKEIKFIINFNDIITATKILKN